MNTLLTPLSAPTLQHYTSRPLTFQPLTTATTSTNKFSTPHNEKKILPQLKGLPNPHNLCYLNSVIQALKWTQPMTEWANGLLQSTSSVQQQGDKCDRERERKEKEKEERGRRIWKEELGTTMRVGKECGTRIDKRFMKGRQEDAHEFLVTLLDKLNPLSVYNQTLQSTVTCAQCRKPSHTTEKTFICSLDLVKKEHTLQGILRGFTCAEKLMGKNAYACENCNAKHPALKQFTFKAGSPAMIFHLKRFAYNHMGHTGKLNGHIAFPEELDMAEFMFNAKSSSSTKYQVNAVLTHSGHSLNHGHYYTYIKGPIGLWCRMDDTSVTRVTLNEVLSQKAYILIYTKKAVEEQPPDNIVKKKKKRKRSTAEGDQSILPSSSTNSSTIVEAKSIEAMPASSSHVQPESVSLATTPNGNSSITTSSEATPSAQRPAPTIGELISASKSTSQESMDATTLLSQCLKPLVSSSTIEKSPEQNTPSFDMSPVKMKLKKKKRSRESSQWLITPVVEVSDKDGIQSKRDALELAKERESELQEKTPNVLKHLLRNQDEASAKWKGLKVGRTVLGKRATEWDMELDAPRVKKVGRKKWNKFGGPNQLQKQAELQARWQQATLVGR